MDYSAVIQDESACKGVPLLRSISWVCPPLHGKDIKETPLEMDLKKAVTNVLAGFNMDPEIVAQKAIDSVADSSEAAELLTEVLNEFYRVESLFEDPIEDDAVRALTKANAENFDVVVAKNTAHRQLKSRGALVSAMIRQLDVFADRFCQEIPSEVVAALQQVASLKNKGCGEIVLAAEEKVRMAKIPAFEVRLADLRNKLADSETDLIELSRSFTLSAGVDLLTNLLGDEDAAIRASAMEVYTRRVYRTYEITDISVGDEDGRLSCSFSFQFAHVPLKDRITRQGFFSVIQDASLCKRASSNPQLLWIQALG